ncbi:uncharacterized protein DS421_1g31180 [Arachis hypogaea]|nr:uncharacterized protein DS421_1g31180 [Arachis hypogaea]
MTTGSRGRPSWSRGRCRRKVSIESPAIVQSSPSTPTTPSTLMTQQASPADQQFIMVPHSNYVPSSAVPSVDPVIEIVVGDSSSAPNRMPLHHRLLSG